MTHIVYNDLSELKNLKTPKNPESYMKVIATESFVLGFGTGFYNVTRGDIIELGIVYDTHTTIYGRSIDISELKEKTLPFSWTRGRRIGYDKATIYPWK